jgi:hypothetical protein
MTGWLSLGRPVADLWALSPAQLTAVFEANGMIQRSADPSTLFALAGQIPNAVVERVASFDEPMEGV